MEDDAESRPDAEQQQEAMVMADQILVMHEGRIAKRFARGAATAEMIVSAAMADDNAGAPP